MMSVAARIDAKIPVRSNVVLAVRQILRIAWNLSMVDLTLASCRVDRIMSPR